MKLWMVNDSRRESEKVWKKEILDNQETKDIANKPPKQLV